MTILLIETYKMIKILIKTFTENLSKWI